MGDFANNFKDCDAIPIKVNRVFDSCSDKDCINNVSVTFTDTLPGSAKIVKTKCITVEDVCINVEPVPFNKGFYSVDITFTFNVQMLAYESACDTPTPVSGTATICKNCILFGSETSSKTFSSDGTVVGRNGDCCNIINPPTALVQAVSPLVLESKISDRCSHCDYDTEERSASRRVLLTIGLFYVVELVRPVTIMVPAYHYTIPQKQCCANNDSPCEVFDKIKFPTEEFSPAILENSQYECPCNNSQRLLSEECNCQDI